MKNLNIALCLLAVCAVFISHSAIASQTIECGVKYIFENKDGDMKETPLLDKTSATIDKDGNAQLKHETSRIEYSVRLHSSFHNSFFSMAIVDKKSDIGSTYNGPGSPKGSAEVALIANGGGIIGKPRIYTLVLHCELVD